MRIPFLEKIRQSVVLFDGGMGTELYRRGVFINKCYDELNLSNPALVEQVHRDYRLAGADVLETNTFGANPVKLEAHGLLDQLEDINRRGAGIARLVAGDDLYVAGSIGPLGIQMEPLGPLAREEARELFARQIRALCEGGVDLFVLETFIYPEELEQAILAVREVCDKPVIAHVTINDDTSSLTGARPEVVVRELADMKPDVLGVNCTVGPSAMLNWLERARELTDLPISIMPNAGKPKSVDGRNIYLTSPEYLGTYAKRYIQNGANVIGGCCGTGPEHIKAMRNAISAYGFKVVEPVEKEVPFEVPADVQVIPREEKSRLARRLTDGHFVTFVELVAPTGVSAQREIEKAKRLFFYGVDVINIPDGPRASARMSAMAMAATIQREVGIETVLHYACRDRNVIGIQSDLLGAWALGIRNILAVTGDPPKLGNYPDATAVFDVDAIGLVNIINRLNHGLDIAGNPIGPPAGMHIGVAANPGALDMDLELRRLDWKVEAGAEFIVTQPIFDLDAFYAFTRRIKHIRLPLIAGLWPLASLRNAEFMKNEVPGCNVPDHIMERMRRHADRKDSGRAEGITIAHETLEQIKEHISGVQISAPFGRIETVMEILDGVRLR
ncbi:MAG: bifunctional homocysteine S-methyltransferase/methylenetetrahydrofolate reductase [Bacteroidetes bacterium]|nr:bifunctional homocysteine S-methyltransferase/methylenetetrahydrofolate reductase [Bacteroidota bacterium]